MMEAELAEPKPTQMTSHKALRSLVVVLGSGPAVQGIVLSPGDRLFDEAKVKIKQFLGLRDGSSIEATVPFYGG